MIIVNVIPTYNFTKKHNIFSSNDEYTPRNVSILSAHMNPFNSLVQNQVGKLIDAAKVPNQCPSIPQQHHKFLFVKQECFDKKIHEFYEDNNQVLWHVLSNSSSRWAVPAKGFILLAIAWNNFINFGFPNKICFQKLCMDNQPIWQKLDNLDIRDGRIYHTRFEKQGFASKS